MNEMDDLNRPSNGPLVTVVTPSFNQGGFIRETIESVLSQNYASIEYLIIDGASTDNTLGVLKTYADRLFWLSEPDQGQADAVNKGFRRAKGEIFGWLNSDDTYQPGAIRKVVEFFQTNPDISMVYGEGYNVDAQGKFIERHPTEEFDYQRLAETCFISQPTVFLRRHVFEEVGPLDTSLHYCLDYEYWMRVGKRFRIGYMPEVIATTRFHGAAKTVAKRKEAQQEVISIVQRHYSLVPLRTIYVYSYITLLEQFMPNVQGVYPNGWATSHVRVFLHGKQAPSVSLHIEGRIGKNTQPITLQLRAADKTVERRVPTQGAFSLTEVVPTDGEIQIDTMEKSRECDRHIRTDAYSFPPEKRPFSYRLSSGCDYAIRKLTITDGAGRQKDLFSTRVAFVFIVALPFLIVRNTLRINGRLCIREQFKSLFNLCRAVFTSGQISRKRANS
jgi:glycosyltransferase involved in cell wall biosynthesis